MNKNELQDIDLMPFGKHKGEPMQTSDDPAFAEWNRLKQQLDSANWTASEASTFYAFFLHGWYGRSNQAAYQHSPNTQAQPRAGHQ